MGATCCIDRSESIREFGKVPAGTQDRLLRRKARRMMIADDPEENWPKRSHSSRRFRRRVILRQRRKRCETSREPVKTGCRQFIGRTEKVRNDGYRIQEGLKETPVLYLREAGLVQYDRNGNDILLRPVHSKCRSGQPAGLGSVLPPGFRFRFQLQPNPLRIFETEENPGFKTSSSARDPG